jgi:hypothetical protein
MAGVRRAASFFSRIKLARPRAAAYIEHNENMVAGPKGVDKQPGQGAAAPGSG